MKRKIVLLQGQSFFPVIRILKIIYSNSLIDFVPGQRISPIVRYSGCWETWVITKNKDPDQELFLAIKESSTQLNSISLIRAMF